MSWKRKFSVLWLGHELSQRNHGHLVLNRAVAHHGCIARELNGLQSSDNEATVTRINPWKGQITLSLLSPTFSLSSYFTVCATGFKRAWTGKGSRFLNTSSLLWLEKQFNIRPLLMVVDGVASSFFTSHSTQHNAFKIIK